MKAGNIVQFTLVDTQVYGEGSAAYFAHQHTNPYKMDSEMAVIWQSGYSAAERSDNLATINEVQP